MWYKQVGLMNLKSLCIPVYNFFFPIANVNAPFPGMYLLYPRPEQSGGLLENYEH